MDGAANIIAQRRSERLAVHGGRHEHGHGDDEHEQHASQQRVRPARRPAVLAEQQHAPERAHQRQRLHGVGGGVARRLPRHERERVPEAGDRAGEQRDGAALAAVAEVGGDGGARHAGHGAVQQPRVERDAGGQAGQREVEEGGVDDQARRAVGQGAPLVVRGQVERRREERVADAREDHHGQAEQRVGAQHLVCSGDHA
jgi:hypothetical protein